ncbi:MAG: trypsin-like peptidase domain-containing protein [Clostridia bacterium]|nr:trypsin-like peptidase domain-containing protein [Clostridia bacterium]
MENNNNKGELFGFDEQKEKTYEPTAAEILEETILKDEKEDEGKIETEVKPHYNTQLNYGGYTNEPKKKKPTGEKKFTLSALVASVVIAAIIGSVMGVGSFITIKTFMQPQGSNETNSSAPSTENAAPNNPININVQNMDATVVEAVAKKVTPSVVGIRTTISVNNFFGGTSESSGEGSGVVYTDDGYIITNYHVIAEAVEYSGNSPEISVFLANGNEEGYKATVVGYNISHDLAVIKIDAKGLTPVELADSSDLKVGQFVVAIGNPGGLEFMGSVTYGVISGLNRIISDTNSSSAVELIQTDAAINPGNSGGALVNTEGKLVGVNSSKIVSESYEGMGFSIPTNTTKDICDKIIAKEYDPDPYIGVTISERYDAETLKRYGFPVGAVVYSVASGSPAEAAGIKSGDIITEFNGVEITEYTVLEQAISSCKPKDTVTIKIYRSRKYYSANITVGSNNSQ